MQDRHVSQSTARMDSINVTYAVVETPVVLNTLLLGGLWVARAVEDSATSGDDRQL